MTKMVKKLDDNHYLIYEKYSDLKLTGAGIHIAQITRNTHLVCKIFKDDKSIGWCCSLGCGRDRASFISTNDKKARETDTSSKKNQTKHHQWIQVVCIHRETSAAIAMGMEGLHLFLGMKYLQFPY